MGLLSPKFFNFAGLNYGGRYMLARMLKNRNIAVLEVEDVVEKIIKLMLKPELSGEIIILSGGDDAL